MLELLRQRRDTERTLGLMAPDLLRALQGMASVWRTTCNSKGWEPSHVVQYTNALELIKLAKEIGAES